MTENDSPTLRLEDVTKKYDEFVAVDKMNFDVRAGRIFGLLGPNGAGKTTTIRMIVGILAPDSGRIELFGKNMARELQNHIGYLPEERGLYKKMKVGEQLRFFGELKGMSAKQANAAIDLWLAKMKLSEWRNKKTDELSKGMQQKIQFIATVMHEPDLLILDEPFSGLDPINSELLQQIVLELKAQGRTIIFSTHLMEQAEKLSDDICLINRSRKVLSGTLREVKRRFGRNTVALRFDGDTYANILDDRALISSVKHDERNDQFEVTLADDSTAQELLETLVAHGVNVRKFEQIEPSLHEIFVSQVEENSDR
ncbi:MAG: ATP-binding cassette domain-containing protein [Pyrinomonadaceae bacterium]